MQIKSDIVVIRRSSQLALWRSYSLINSNRLSSYRIKSAFRLLSLLPCLCLCVSLVSLMIASQVHAKTYYFHNDQLGSPQAVTDNNRQIVWNGEQDPFGETSKNTGNVEQNLRFPGQYFDVETGLHQNIRREYDPSIGRFTQGDPLGLYDGPSLYGYVSGNPIRFSDPYGLFSMDSVWGFVYTATGGYAPSQNTIDFGAGLGDVLTFGLTGLARELLDINNVNTCSIAYTSGEVTGVLASISTGFVSGTKAFAKQASPVSWTNFSHSLTPNSWRRGSAWSSRGNRLNGDYIPTLGRRPDLHDLMDATAAGIGGNFKTWPSWRRALNRIPYTLGAAAYGLGSMGYNSSNSGCSCN